jgi:DNA-binding Xre family transcriptional regulator
MTHLAVPTRWKFAQFLDANNVNVHSLAQNVDVSITTLYSLKNNRPRRIDLETLDKLKPALESFLGRKVELSELIDWVDE